MWDLLNVRDEATGKGGDLLNLYGEKRWKGLNVHDANRWNLE